MDDAKSIDVDFEEKKKKKKKTAPRFSDAADVAFSFLSRPSFVRIVRAIRRIRAREHVPGPDFAIDRLSRSARREQDATRLAIMSSLIARAREPNQKRRPSKLHSHRRRPPPVLSLSSLSSLSLCSSNNNNSSLPPPPLTMVSKEATASTAAITFGRKSAEEPRFCFRCFFPRSQALTLARFTQQQQQQNFNSSWRRHRMAPQPLRPRQHRQGVQEVQGCVVGMNSFQRGRKRQGIPERERDGTKGGGFATVVVFPSSSRSRLLFYLLKGSSVLRLLFSLVSLIFSIREWAEESALVKEGGGGRDGAEEGNSGSASEEKALARFLLTNLSFLFPLPCHLPYPLRV